MKYCFTILFTILFYSIGYTQELAPYHYYNTIDQAEMASLNNKHLLADSLFQLAFSDKQTGFAQDYIAAAYNAIKLADKQKVVHYLETGFKNGLVIKELKEHEKKLYQYVKQQSMLKRLKQHYRSIRKAYLLSLNQTLRTEIESMVKEDQHYRKGRYEKKPWKEQQAILKKVDEKNFQKLLEICKKHGFPDRYLVGDEDKVGWVDVPTLLRHMDSTRLKELEPYVMKSIANKGFHPYHYVSALDYAVMFKTSFDDLDENGNRVLIIQQQYGTMLGRENGEKIILPVKTLANINETRSKFGLESIEHYAAKKGCNLPREGVYKRTFPKN